jgi:hypothetical protein
VAGDWIKLEHATLDKPEVLELSELLSVSQGDALLYCLRFWVWVDEQSRDGRLIGRSTAISKKSIDALMHCAGFANALIHVGWLEEHEGVLCIPKFDAHNGETSKKRVLKNRAQANWRESKAANVDATVDALVEKMRSTNASTREEKRRVLTPSPLFAEFWTAYPKRKNRGQAERAWQKLKPNEQLLADILQGIERAKTSEFWRKDSGRFIPFPATWLNAKGWLDEDEQTTTPRYVAP